MSNIQPKFEGPSLKNEKVQNFDHFWKFFEKNWDPKSKTGLLEDFGIG